ncbi:mechanosensitive ion channel family protein [Haloferula chungangensis]|uniref:Mechanosensitive ion channel family protein n=1 Tax=Haloferula chungangensis TaxID=1048331 RepID=A0ABW2L2B0_9BACT
MIRLHLVVLFLFLFNAPLFAEDRADKENTPEPAELVVWQRDIVTFRASIATLSPTIRRDTALRRIQELPEFSLYDPVTAQSVKLGDLNGVSFLSGKRLLFTLVEGDINSADGETLEGLSSSVVTRLDALRIARLEQRNWKINLKGFGISVLATLVLAAFLYGLQKLNRIIRRFFVRSTSKLSTLKQRDLDLRPAFLQISRRITAILISVIGIGACYLWITAVLGQFPFSAPWAAVLGKHVTHLGGEFFSSVLASIPNLLMVVLIFFLTRGTARITTQVLRSFEGETESDSAFAKDTARATRRIASVLIWIFGLVIAYPYIPGSDSDAFKGVGVLLGLMISLGSTGLVNQLMSGFVVLYSGAVRTGEYARVGDVEGVITDIGLLSTKVRTPKNEYVTVPNAVLIAKDTLNYSRLVDDQRTELCTAVTIGYDTPWRQVHELLLRAADRTPGIRENPEPKVVQTALSDFYVAYELRFVPADITRKGAVLSDLHQRIQDAFAEAKVQIMSPNFVAQPEALVLPPEE